LGKVQTTVSIDDQADAPSTAGAKPALTFPSGKTLHLGVIERVGPEMNTVDKSGMPTADC
jgi:hypothetical protein